MTTPISTQSSFSYFDKPQQVPINRNGQILATGNGLPASASQTWYPSGNNSYDLGTPGLRWKDLWLSGSLYAGANVAAGSNVTAISNVIGYGSLQCGAGGVQTTNSAYPNIGSLSGPFNQAYINNINALGRISAGAVVATSSLTVTGASLFTGTMLPTDNALYNIGTTLKRWNTVYATNLDFSGIIYKDGVEWTPVVSLPTLTGNLLPSVTATYDIGVTGTRWKDGWFSGTVTAGTVATTTLTASGASTLGATSITALTATTASINANSVISLLPLLGNGTGVIGGGGARFAAAYINAIVAQDTVGTTLLAPIRVGLSDEITPTTYVGNFQQKFSDGYIGSVWANIVQPFTNGTGNVKTLGTNANHWASLYCDAIVAPTSFTGVTACNLTVTTGSTVGAAGAASALPGPPLGYMTLNVNGVAVKVPYYTA